MNPRHTALLDSVKDNITRAEEAISVNWQREWLKDAEASLKRVIATLPAK